MDRANPSRGIDSVTWPHFECFSVLPCQIGQKNLVWANSTRWIGSFHRRTPGQVNHMNYCNQSTTYIFFCRRFLFPFEQKGETVSLKFRHSLGQQWTHSDCENDGLNFAVRIWILLWFRSVDLSFSGKCSERYFFRHKAPGKNPDREKTVQNNNSPHNAIQPLFRFLFFFFYGKFN